MQTYDQWKTVSPHEEPNCKLSPQSIYSRTGPWKCSNDGYCGTCCNVDCPGQRDNDGEMADEAFEREGDR